MLPPSLSPTFFFACLLVGYLDGLPYGLFRAYAFVFFSGLGFGFPAAVSALVTPCVVLARLHLPLL